MSLPSRAQVAGTQSSKEIAPAPPSEPFSVWTVSGYGEAIASTRFFGPDPNVDYSREKYRETDVDLARLVFNVGYGFTDKLSLQTEIEIEHGGTGTAMEVEWEEFGEYETEVEKGGELNLEQAFLQAVLHEAPRVQLGARAGRLLSVVGTIAPYHQPILFSSTERPESEAAVLPSTWHESGAELFGRAHGFEARLQAVTGLDSTGFSSKGWISGGTQRRFEKVRANDWGLGARLDYSGIRGLSLGISGYTSNTTGNRPKRDMEDVRARVWMADLHTRFQFGAFRLRHLALIGFLENADLITEKNSSLSQNLDVPRTPVGSSVYASYLEVAFDVWSLLAGRSKTRFDIFGRTDWYDTMWTPPDSASGLDIPLLETRVVTAGLNYFPHPRIVLKGDYTWRFRNQNSNWGRREQQFNFALGFVM